MGNARVKCYLFFLSSVFLGVCAFIPILKGIDVTASGDEVERIFKMMPGVDGFLILVPVIFCVICALVGYQKSVPLLGTVTSICSAIALWHMSSRIRTMSTTVYVMNLVFDPINGVDTVVSTTNVYLSGFYLTILAIILTLVTSFMYGLADREDY